MPKDQFDMIIVGAGAVGSTLALALQMDGYSVAIIDARLPDYGSSDPERVIALSYGSRCYLDGLGVWQDIQDLGVIKHVQVSEPGQNGLVTMDAASAESDMDALGYVVEMGKVLEPLHDALRNGSRDGLREEVTWFCPATVVSMQIEEASASISIQQDNHRKTLSAALIVAADGTNSLIRQLAAINTRGWDYNRFGLVASVQTEYGHQHTAHECFKKSGPLAFLPLADDRFSIVWALAPQEATRLLSMPEAMFLKKLASAAGEHVMGKMGRFQSMGQRACFPLELRIADTFSLPRLALIGNAAHTIHPVAGQGMNLGLRDVAVLAEVLSGELGHQDAGSSILMQAYAEQRRLDVMAVTGFTEGMTQVFGNQFTPTQMLRSYGLSAMQQWPSLSDALLKQASGTAQMQGLKLPQGDAP